MRTENLTIAFVDIKDYTPRTSDTSREDNEKLLGKFGSLVRPLAKAFHGKVVKSLGDAFLLTFASPTDCLHWAMAVQDHLAETNLGLEEAERFEVRVAINVGEVRVEHGDVFGEAVNIAARIEALADGGEICFSEAVYLVMNKSEVPSAEVGKRELKGVPEPVRIYRVPKANEGTAYRLAMPAPSESELASESAAQEEHPLSLQLPYGGLSLQKVKGHLPHIHGALPAPSPGLSLRAKLLVGISVAIMLIAGAGIWMHHEQTLRAEAAQLRMLAEKQSAELEGLKKKEAAARRALAQQKEASKFHWPWQSKAKSQPQG